MLVRESISFERGKDPKEVLDIGENNLYVKTKLFNELEEKGISINLDWSSTGIEKERTIENIYEFMKSIDKLLKAGLTYKDMEISHHDSINIKVIRVMAGNRVIHECLTKEDANILIKAIKNFTAGANQKESIITDIGSHFFYLEDNQKWLDDIIDNRKKYKSIK